MQALFSFYEKFLGDFETAGNNSWFYDPKIPPGNVQENPYPYAVLQFNNVPHPGICTYITLGASGCLLEQIAKPAVRMEFLICAESRFPPTSVVRVLMGFANAAMRLHRAPVDGEVIEWKRSLFSKDEFRYLYVTHPLLFEDDLALFVTSSPPTIVAQLIPLSEREADYASRSGADFNRLLISQRAHLWDLDERPELVTH